MSFAWTLHVLGAFIKYDTGTTPVDSDDHKPRHVDFCSIKPRPVSFRCLSRWRRADRGRVRSVFYKDEFRVDITRPWSFH